ncbi:MAG: hemerythrin domain-containing protein [Acidobacteria bacterium]|nr:hemerythrin domain-containing protein [Acidobacteriota bacterium]
MRLEIPRSIEIEHRELHRELAAATQVPGRTGEAAQHVAALLHGHFEREEEFALPPLALLGPLAGGRVPAEAETVIAMTDRLETELARMLDEHEAIVVALNDLERAARDERHPEVVRFVEQLELHAQREEEILYPAAILVGKYLKLQPAR